MVLGSKVVGSLELFHRLCDKGKGCTKVVGNIGEENKLRLGGNVELLVQCFLCIALLSQKLILLYKDLLMAFMLPKSPEQHKHKPKQQHNNGYRRIEKCGLCRMSAPVIIDLRLQQLYFCSLFFKRLILKQQYIGIRLVDRR